MSKDRFAVLTFVLLALIAIMIVTLIGQCNAETLVKFYWDASPSSDIAEYYVYQSDTSGNYYTDANRTIYDKSKRIAAVLSTKLETQEIKIQDGSWYWIVTAFDSYGNESAPSNEVHAVFDSSAPIPPSNFRHEVEAVITIRVK